MLDLGKGRQKETFSALGSSLNSVVPSPHPSPKGNQEVPRAKMNLMHFSQMNEVAVGSRLAGEAAEPGRLGR